jgi:hypothetical protein
MPFGYNRPAVNTAKPRKLKFIGCEIIYREACYLAATGPLHVDVEFLRKGLHDLERADMSAKVQAAIDAVPPAAGYEAILLGYARCNDGLVGVTARGVPLVIPRAHDCITFFFGSRAAYMEHFDAHPGTYYMTTGWSERNVADEGRPDQPAYGRQGVMGKLGLTESYEQMVAKYGKENADFIRESIGDWTKNYSRLLYLEMGVRDEGPYIDAARGRAEDRGWTFDLRKGDWRLLRKLFLGEWDEDFVIVPPGGKIVARNDDLVLDVG